MNETTAHPGGGRSAVTIALVVCTMSLTTAVGCGGKGDQAARDAEKARASKQDDFSVNSVISNRKRKGNLQSERYQVKTYDLNQDKQPDQWSYRTDAGKLARVERDMNFDGDIDVWQYFNPNGEVVEEEMDLDMDGRIDLVAYYEDGTILRKEMSVDFNQNFGITKFYNKDGRLLRVERDKDGDTKTDVWEYYNDKGKRERIGWDDNDDGVPDAFNQLP